MRALSVLALVGLIGAPAWAETTHSVRLMGQAPEAKDPVPASFVLDLTLTKGDSPFQEDVSGWFAALPPGVGSAEPTPGAIVLKIGSSRCTTAVSPPIIRQ